jgi:hypothetical protein
MTEKKCKNLFDKKFCHVLVVVGEGRCERSQPCLEVEAVKVEPKVEHHQRLQEVEPEIVKFEKI